ncbi:MAG: DUF1501 domain-containing protein [Saprospiraceae bacterium]
MKRRSFLTNTGKVISLPVLLNGLNINALTASPLFNAMNSNTDRVLVIVRLNGGNDGLNMLMPVDQYDKLQNIRGNIMLPQNDYLDLGNSLNLAFHPDMTGVKSLFDDAKLNIVQNVSYPNQNRSHFRSTDIWTSGSPADEVWTNGWLGRYFDTQYAGYPTDYPNDENPDPIALSIDSQVAETCQGLAGNFSLAVTDPFSLSPLAEGAQTTPPDSFYGDELSFLYDTLEQTNAYGDVIVNAANLGNNLATYPDTQLAEQLSVVARLIAGGLKTKVYVVSQGGYDTHANQVVANMPDRGRHSDLLTELSAAIAAFQNDLQMQSLEERVLGMTFSEFGRQIASNFSYGTDHGTAAPLMLFGSCVNAGVMGENPDIPDTPEPQEGVAMQHDFRDIYGSVLMDWFDVPQAEVENLLYADFSYMPIATSCDTVLSIDNQRVTQEEAIEKLRQLKINPNPIRQTAQVSFHSFGEKIRLSIFDARGQEVQILADRNFTQGEHQVRWEAHRLTSGNYYCRLKTKHGQQTRRVVKI